ncbi:5-oxoprolinase/urea amidolyase family protein [Candidatus Bathyarchaeota archaeon]|nr:5-oxoprolinase/urea amidolyase family protein [Candidatus Bathyarchaeota archaeon]
MKLSIEVMKPGIETTVQDYPGRIGYWDLGIPPSGGMDDYSLRVANLLVGNNKGAAVLEVTAGLFSINAREDLVTALAGADMGAKLNNHPAPLWESFLVRKGDVISLPTPPQRGFRSYVAFAGGIDVPNYLGSSSTFAAGGFGGVEGRLLKAGDVLKTRPPSYELKSLTGRKADPRIIPEYTNEIEVEAIVGPHADPDFLTEDGVQDFFAENHRVDRNSNRLGYRLQPRTWKWSRTDGGVAGKHPSNIIDNGYSVGSINISGDQPIILMKDGPSAGGFICLCCVPSSAMWKIGQAAPGRDSLRFRRTSYEKALAMRNTLEEKLENGIAG